MLGCGSSKRAFLAWCFHSAWLTWPPPAALTFPASAGRPVYLPESERLSGRHARLTQRLQKRAARRSGSLQLAYSLSMALSFFLIVSDALAKAPPPGQ